MHVAFNLIAGAAFQLQGVIIDVALRHIDEVNLASEAAVVPPIGLQRRHRVSAAGVIYGDDDEIASRLQRCGHIAVEWSEAALVVAHMHVVHKD